MTKNRMGSLEVLLVRKTVEDALLQGTELLLQAGIDNARYEASLVLMFVLKCRREDLIREPERRLDTRQQLIFSKSINLRAERRPLAYISGVAWFYGRSFKVNRAVLIPRPETEMLVDFAIQKSSSLSHRPTIADIGTGSGCIAVTVALELQGSHVVAVDISDLALLIANKNIARYSVGEQVSSTRGDLVDALTDKRFDIILSNPPYISEGDRDDLMPEVRDYEPASALSEGAGVDGTAIHRRLLECARAKLKSGGWIAMEVGAGQADKVFGYARDYGYKAVEMRADFSGIDRVVAAQWTD